MYTVYLKVQVECDGEDVECQLLRPSTDVDGVFAGDSPVVLQRRCFGHPAQLPTV